MNYRFAKLISLFKKLGNVLKPLMAQGVFVFVPNVLIIGKRFLPVPNSDEHKIVYEAIVDYGTSVVRSLHSTMFF